MFPSGCPHDSLRSGRDNPLKNTTSGVLFGQDPGLTKLRCTDTPLPAFTSQRPLQDTSLFKEPHQKLGKNFRRKIVPPPSEVPCRPQGRECTKAILAPALNTSTPWHPNHSHTSPWEVPPREVVGGGYGKFPEGAVRSKATTSPERGGG